MVEPNVTSQEKAECDSMCRLLLLLPGAGLLETEGALGAVTVSTLGRVYIRDAVTSVDRLEIRTSSWLAARGGGNARSVR